MRSVFVRLSRSVGVLLGLVVNGLVRWDKAVQVRTGKLCRVLIRPGWVGHGKAVKVRWSKER